MTPEILDYLALRKELEILKRDQDMAMALATYTGMTPEQAAVFDKRRRRITELYEALLRAMS